MTVSRLTPTTFEQAATALAGASEEGQALRIVGGATKLGWGRISSEAALELRTEALDQIIEHNEGDLTAILQAGVPLARAQETFAAKGQMFALDPPLGPERAATIGGAIATGDSGPLRHRYGAPRDLVVGMTVALSDGTIARSGGKVIKNVAGYDIAKLFAGSFGTLGMILSVSIRLHPLPIDGATAFGSSSDPETLARAAQVLASAPLELEALDVAWRAGAGGILAQTGGAEAPRRSERVAALMREARLEQVDFAGDDASFWARQRAGQRSAGRALVRIAARPSALADVLRLAQSCGGTLVGRAALGTSFIELDPEAVGGLREGLPAGAFSAVLDAPAELRRELDPWHHVDPGALMLMQRVKAQFDRAGACNPGVFVGGI